MSGQGIPPIVRVQRPDDGGTLIINLNHVVSVEVDPDRPATRSRVLLVNGETRTIKLDVNAFWDML